MLVNKVKIRNTFYLKISIIKKLVFHFKWTKNNDLSNGVGHFFVLDPIFHF
jgi:hypothetical protein